MASLSTTLAALRRAESGSFRGNYSFRGERGQGGTPEGAYGILNTNWRPWAASAGISGANSKSRLAQDKVAAHVLQSYYNRYGSWELATAAWYGGTKSADIIQRRGGKIRNAKIARFVKQVGNFQKHPEVNNYSTNTTRAVRSAAAAGGESGWVFPVAGGNEWSGGSYMAKHTKGDRSHYAIDVYSAKGTPIVSPVGGTVTKVGVGGKLGGNTVAVLGNDGVTYYFAHMSGHAKGLERGQKIMAGHHLGAVGNSGSARGTKPHLHFSMKKNGKPLNPKVFLNGAETANGLYATDLQYEEAQEGDLSTPQGDAPFGTTGPEQMVEQVSNVMAGGVRLDPREWIDPNVDELDLNKEKTDMGKVL